MLQKLNGRNSDLEKGGLSRGSIFRLSSSSQKQHSFKMFVKGFRGNANRRFKAPRDSRVLDVQTLPARRVGAGPSAGCPGPSSRPVSADRARRGPATRTRSRLSPPCGPAPRHTHAARPG